MKHDCCFKLFFDMSLDDVCLNRTEFTHPLNGQSVVSFRGKNSSRVVSHTGSFQWSNAVKAMSDLMLNYKLVSLRDSSSSQASIVGESGSLASSLDYAISKQPNWLLDMFGVDSKGSSIFKRLIIRLNSERRKPGPVQIFLKTDKLLSCNVGIYLNSYEVKEWPIIQNIREMIGSNNSKNYLQEAA